MTDLELHRLDICSLAEIVRYTKRRVIEHRIATHPSLQSAANSLGITREGLYKLRKLYGITSDRDGKSGAPKQ